MLTHLRKLQPAECAGWRQGELEVFLGSHPSLHGLQFARCQVGGVVLDQVALKLVGLEVEMHRYGMAHGEVPGSTHRNGRGRKIPISKPDLC